MKKKNIAVFFGGQSSEHEISCISVQTVIANINADKYHIIPVGITQEGQWLLVDSLEDIANDTWRQSKTRAILSPDATKKELLLEKDGVYSAEPVDVIFPVLHGFFGEDGTIQGLFELAHIPYVGCGVLASAVAMDKFYTKVVVDTLGIRQAKWVPVRTSEFENMEEVLDRVEASLDYPVFVKPSNAGSSVGVSKANDRQALVESLKLAGQHDTKILVEETIVGREIECAVLGGAEVKASGVGEIHAAVEADFYDFDAKYKNPDSTTVVDPEFPEGVREQVRKNAVAIFKAIDGFGLSRVDFFLTNETNEVVFNEINTLPGFTAISMYPTLWEAQGVSKQELVEELIELAYTRHAY